MSQPVYRCSAFIDIVGSADRKHSEPEISWVNQTHYVYSTVENAVFETVGPSTWLKYSGDGFLVITEEQEAMINACIRIQEGLADGRDGHAAGASKINFTVSIGITSGLVYEFQRRDGGTDYLGLSIDRAARLCSAASSNAIFVDAATVSDAKMRMITSRVGNVLRYGGNDYAGPVQSAPLRGFPDPVDFHELRWDRELYGARSQVVTDAVGLLKDKTSPHAETATDNAAGAGRPAAVGRIERGLAAVQMWDPAKRFGFAKDSTTGEEFYFHVSNLVYAEDAVDLASGVHIAYTPAPATREGGKRSAAAILIVENDAEGVVVSLPEGKNHGWIRVTDRSGNSQMVYFNAIEHPTITRGMTVTFVVGARSGKAYAKEVELAS